MENEYCDKYCATGVVVCEIEPEEIVPEPISLPLWLRLRSAVRSLEDSTGVTISTVWGSVEIEGRASPYKSHTSLLFSAACIEGWAGTVQISNGKHALVIAPSSARYGEPDPAPSEDGLLRTRWVRLRVPANAVAELVRQAHEYFPVETGRDRFCAPAGLVDVLLAAPILVGWEKREDDEGGYRVVPVFERVDPEPESEDAQEDESSLRW